MSTPMSATATMPMRRGVVSQRSGGRYGSCTSCGVTGPSPMGPAPVYAANATQRAGSPPKSSTLRSLREGRDRRLGAAGAGNRNAYSPGPGEWTRACVP